jgi:alkaline phosphatase
MTSAALSILERDPDGFFLLVEQEGTDSSGHLVDPDDSKIERNVFAALEFSDSVQVVLDWAAGRDDTLVLVTADHETGGLEILADNGPGAFPTVAWAGDFHTPVEVGVYAWGPNAELVSGVIDNTDIFRIATVPEPGTLLLLGVGLTTLATARRSR